MQAELFKNADLIIRANASGYGMCAHRNITEGAIVMHEEAFAVLRAASLEEACSSDPELVALIDRAKSPAAIPDLLRQVILRFAALEIAKLPEPRQAQWMSLTNAFAEPPQEKNRLVTCFDATG